MSKNKIIAFVTVIAAILIVVLPTIFKIYQGYEERTFQVAAKKILESASDCYKDGVCINQIMTIDELKKTGYLKEDVINPRTRTYFEGSLKMIEKDFEVTFMD